MEDLFTTMVIDSYEGLDIVTFGVTKACFNSKLPKDKHVLLTLIGDNGTKVIYHEVL